MAKYTQKAIIESFMELLRKKSLDKITVKDIIESAGINRNTFYYYYKNIYDLLGEAFKEEAVKFKSEAISDNSFYEAYMRTVNFLLEHKATIIHVYNSKSKDVLYSYLEFATNYFISKFVEKRAKGTKISEAGKKYIVNFYSDAIIGATSRWIERKMTDYKEVLMKDISESFEATIDEMIEAYIKGHPEECI